MAKKWYEARHFETYACGCMFADGKRIETKITDQAFVMVMDTKQNKIVPYIRIFAEVVCGKQKSIFTGQLKLELDTVVKKE